MGVFAVAIALSLVVVTTASQQVLCKASEVSLLNFTARVNIQPINCVINPTEFVLSKDQFDSIISRLETLERELSSTKSDLASFESNLRRSYTSNGWTASGNYVFKLFKERVDWITARQRCQSHGGRLAAEILRRRDAVRHIIDENYVNTYQDGTAPWVGFYKIPGTWKWIDGGSTTGSTTAWNSGEPNSDLSTDCGHIFTTSTTKLLLNDAGCTSWRFHYICEIELW